MGMPHDSVEELLKDVSQPTEHREPQMFTDAASTAEKPVAGSIHATTDTLEDGPAITPLSDEVIENGADMVIGLYDFGQAASVSFLVRRKRDKRLVKLFGEGALDKLADLKAELDAAENKNIRITEIRAFSVEEQKAIHLVKQADEVIGDMPMSESEKDLIKIPLMQLMKERGTTLPASWALTFAVMQITGARIAAAASF